MTSLAGTKRRRRLSTNQSTRQPWGTCWRMVLFWGGKGTSDVHTTLPPRFFSSCLSTPYPDMGEARFLDVIVCVVTCSQLTGTTKRTTMLTRTLPYTAKASRQCEACAFSSLCIGKMKPKDLARKVRVGTCRRRSVYAEASVYGEHRWRTDTARFMVHTSSPVAVKLIFRVAARTK